MSGGASTSRSCRSCKKLRQIDRCQKYRGYRFPTPAHRAEPTRPAHLPSDRCAGGCERMVALRPGQRSFPCGFRIRKEAPQVEGKPAVSEEDGLDLGGDFVENHFGIHFQQSQTAHLPQTTFGQRIRHAKTEHLVAAANPTAVPPAVVGNNGFRHSGVSAQILDGILAPRQDHGIIINTCSGRSKYSRSTSGSVRNNQKSV